eukprot:370339-Pyramimonas_sp.AAC.1
MRVPGAWSAAFWARRAVRRSWLWSRVPSCPVRCGWSVSFRRRITVPAPRPRCHTLRRPLSAAAPLVNERRVDS